MRLNLKINVTPIPNVVIQFNILNLLWLRIPIPKPTFIPIPTKLEHEPPILDSW